MTEIEIQQQRDHEAAMEVQRKAFAAAWPALWRQIGILPKPKQADVPLLMHRIAWLVWLEARKPAACAADMLPTISLCELTNAVNAQCSCGGGGPNDKHTCPACHVYHRLVTV